MIIAALAAMLMAQTGTAPALASFSLRPAASPGPGVPAAELIEPTRMTLLQTPVRELLARAFALPPEAVHGPAWLMPGPAGEDARVDLRATATAPVTPEEFFRLVQPELVRRYALVFHRRDQACAYYDLLPGPGGLSGLTVDPDPPPAPPPGGGFAPRIRPVLESYPDGVARWRIRGSATLGLLGSVLAPLFSDHPIEDPSHSPVAYQFDLLVDQRAANDPPTAAEILAGLGLRLEPRSRTVSAIVIDSMNRNPEGP